jgi:hypothetical protein
VQPVLAGQDPEEPLLRLDLCRHKSIFYSKSACSATILYSTTKAFQLDFPQLSHWFYKLCLRFLGRATLLPPRMGY